MGIGERDKGQIVAVFSTQKLENRSTGECRGNVSLHVLV
jgi:hypothetical protein